MPRWDKEPLVRRCICHLCRCMATCCMHIYNMLYSTECWHSSTSVKGSRPSWELVRKCRMQQPIIGWHKAQSLTRPFSWLPAFSWCILLLLVPKMVLTLCNLLYFIYIHGFVLYIATVRIKYTPHMHTHTHTTHHAMNTITYNHHHTV